MSILQKILATLLFSIFPLLHISAGVLVEAESFADKGGWVVDQQFMDIMGSPYLLAHGAGKPVADASTTIALPSTGEYHVYVRTYNWTSPWHKGEGPGRFMVSVNGRDMNITGHTGSRWEWQYAGSVSIGGKEADLVLKDLSGFDGRCDAVYLTKKKDDVPPASGAELAAFRDKISKVKRAEAGEYDLVVVGGGVAGMCAAVSAARLGCSVALINDRPVLGGANSSEIRVPLGGWLNVGPYFELGNMVREFGPSKGGYAQPAETYEDGKKQQFIDAEPNVTVFLNFRAVKVEMDGDRIAGVVAKHIEEGGELVFRAPLFADCTGDGTVGFLAGADFSMGREARDEFYEDDAPEIADKMTMGASVQWNTQEMGSPTGFPLFEYGIAFDELTCQRVTHGGWQWETGMNLDQIWDFERIRDYGMLVIYSNWSYLKNRLADNEKYRERDLDWVAYVAGKRESRRLTGDYILKGSDILKEIMHEDGTASTTWSIDLHYPDPKNTELFPGAEFKSIARHTYITDAYPVPYRCLYSRNVENLFMAGRNISVTHVALGSTRVMRTTGMLGEVVGMAAYLCRKHGKMPRGVYREHLPELKEMMREGMGSKDALDNQNYNRGRIKIKNVKNKEQEKPAE